MQPYFWVSWVDSEKKKKKNITETICEVPRPFEREKHSISYKGVLF